MPAPIAPRRQASAGFTLVEVMVALFVLAMMAAMAWQGLDAVTRSREITQARMERTLRLQSAMGQWEADLRELVDTQMVPGLNFDGATLRLTRRQPEGVQVVAWTLRGGTVHRWSSPTATTLDTLQEAWMRSHQLLGSEPGTLPMLEGVQQWQLFVFLMSSNSWSNAQSSGDLATSEPAPAAPEPGEAGASAPAAPTTPQPPPVAAAPRDVLPDGLRVVVTFEPGGTGDGTLVRDLRLVHP
ncbi:MAG: hypothetical protein RL456_2846 [Pseudomonadota bacterium]|jgi:general secretion pathway protein J